MVFTNITPFPTTLTPLTNISPLTYRDAATFLEYLETIKQWLNETLVPETDTLLENAIAEFQAGIANAEATVTEANADNLLLVNETIEYINTNVANINALMASEQAANRAYVEAMAEEVNNKTGNVQIQRITLAAPYTLNIDPLWPTNHPLNVVFTQDNVGGHAVTLAPEIVGTLDLNTGANESTEFSLIPLGNGSWYVYQPYAETLFDLRKQAGLRGVAPGVDVTAALQKALDAAAAFGVRAFARGTFTISSTIQIISDVDLSGATFNYTGGVGIAVRVGKTGTLTNYISRKEIRLPKIINTNKTANGWAQVAGSVGVEISNWYTGELHVPYINNFETGLKLNGQGNGVCYINIHLGHLDNNKINNHITSATDGWSNQNTFIGGRMSHNSNEGVNVAGTRHILISLTSSKANNNNYFATSLETPNVAEYVLDCAGNDNYFWGCRWESTNGAARIVWRAASIGNMIDQGFGVHTIVETKEAGTANSVRTRGQSRMVGYHADAAAATLQLENSVSVTGHALRVVGAGAEGINTDPKTAWAVAMSAANMKGKRSTDAFERLSVDYTNSRLYFGDGTAAPTKYVGTLGSTIAVNDSDLTFGTDNTHDIGFATSLRPRYIRAASAVVTGAVASGARPAASTAKAGAMIFDTTLQKPLWSDGASWRDATGTIA